MAIIQFKIDINAGDDKTPSEDLIFELYNYGVLYHTSGSVTTDADVSIADTIVTISNIPASDNTTYMFTACAIDAEGNKGEISSAVMISTNGYVTVTTNSTSSTWTPTIVNSGSTLKWDVSGGVTISEVTENAPTFDLSSNTGVATIRAKSTTGFEGMTVLSFVDAQLLSIENSLATDVTDYEVKINTELTTVDLSTMTDVWRLTIRDNALTSVDLSYNTLLSDLYLYGNELTSLNIDSNSLLSIVNVTNNNLTGPSLDYIVNKLDSYGVTNGDLKISSNPGSISSSAYDGYANLIAKGWVIDVSLPEAPESEGTAILSEFYINPLYTNRVYFNSSGDITGLTTNGFVISGKTISSITINGVDTSGHYFRVTEDFTFWDNTTIRLGEHSDTSNKQSIVFNFTLTYIENNIPEPAAFVNRYVSTTGSGDGTSESNPASLSYMASNASPGQTWWIKAGDYGDVTYLTLGNSGTTTNPIKYIGYKTTIGDITTNYFDYGVTMSSTEMPTISSDPTSSNSRGISLTGDYFILRNFQTSEYYRSLFSNDGYSDNFVIDRFNVEDNYDATITGGTGIHFVGSTGMNNARIINSVFINCSMSGITLQGSGYSHNLIDNCKTYNDQIDEPERQDYQIVINGSNSIIRNCYSENFNTTSTNGSTHGIGIKGAGYNPNNYNLIEKSTAVNMLEGFYFRNSAIQYSVIKDCISTKTHTGGYTGEVSGGLWLWGGVDYNIIERNIFRNTIYGIALRDNSGEDGTPTPAVGDNNIIRNNIIHDTKFALAGTTNESGSDWNDNTLVNNTFSNCTYIYRNVGSFITISNFNILNNIFYNVGGLADGNSNLTGWNFDYNNFYNSWTAGIGENDINVDPNFVNTINGDFEPQNEALLIAPPLFGVEYDFEGGERGLITTIGAVKHVNEIVEEPTYTPNYYISSSSGDDSNDGLSSATPWQTLSKVEAEITSADAGKVIAFKKGDEWNELFNISGVDGTLGNEIVFTSYGSGDKPIIHDCTEGTLAWTNIGGNIWRNTSITGQVSRIEVDGTERLGGWNVLYSQLGDSVPDLLEWFWGDNGDSNNYLYFYSATDPNTFNFKFSSETDDSSRSVMFINCNYLTLHDLDFRGGWGVAVTVYGCGNLTFDGCDVGYLAEKGIDFLYYSGVHCTDIIIKNCDFDTKYTLEYDELGTYSSAENTGADDAIYIRSLKGAEIYNNTFTNWGHSMVSLSSQGIEADGYVSSGIKVHGNTFTQALPYGRGFGMSGNAHDNEIYNNRFIYNTAPIQINGYNNHFHHNIIEKAIQTPLKLYKQAAVVLQGYALFAHDNIIENNLFLDCYGPGFGIDGYHTSCNVENNTFRNNILNNCGTDQSGLTIDLKVDESGDYDAVNNIFQNNIIYNTSETNTINDNGTTRTVATWNGTTTKGNTVENNLSSNPDFISTSDYHLQENSPGVNNGNLILASADYEGNTIPYNSTRNDIGLYESEWTTVSTTPDPTLQYTPTYYVSNSTGSDSNDGTTEQTAWQTLSKVESYRDNFVAGDVVAFKGGDQWYGRLYLSSLTVDGTVDNPIVFTSYGTGQPEIVGYEPIIGWTNTSGNIWEASTVGKTVYNVMKDEDLQMNARFPDLVSDLLPESSMIQVTSVTSQTNIIVSGLLGLTDLVGANLIILTSPWLVEQVEITAYNNSTGELTLDATDVSNLEGTISSGDNCFVNNHYNLLSAEKEWHYDSVNDKLYVYSTSIPTDINATTTDNSGIVAEYVSHYIFDNLKVVGFAAAGIEFSSGSNVTVQNCAIKNNMKGGVLSWSGDDNIIDNNTFSGHGSRSVQNIGNCTITNNHITDNGLYSQRSYRNTISPDLEGIIVSNNSTIEYNYLKNIGYHGINAGKVSIVRYNYIENTCLASEDGGAIYFDSTLAGGSVVENNILIANPSLTDTWGSQGIYLDENTIGITCDENTIVGFNFNVQIHVAGGSTFTNNNLYKSVGSSFRTSDKSYSSDVVDMVLTGNNIYLESADEFALKMTNTDGLNYDIGTLNNNNYSNPLTNDVINVQTTAPLDVDLELSEWVTLSSEDANSVQNEYPNWASSGESQIIYNWSDTTTSNALTGTWWKLDGTQQGASIDVASYSSVILTNQEPQEVSIPIDTEAPVFVSNLTIDGETATSLQLHAEASDNVGIDHWEIVVDGSWHSNSSDGDVLNHTLEGLFSGQTYSIIVQPHDAENNYTNSSTVNGTTTSTVTAQLSNFTINDTNKDRVYFDASGDISTMTTTGFVISGKTITAVDVVNKYFTVSAPFTFWDNNTIRLGEHTDTSDSQSALHNFTLSYIENNIPEPDASTNRYVTTAASGGGNGLSEGTAWTWTEAVANASAGMTIWIKAGNYGSYHYLDMDSNGTVDNPIKYIGYKNTIGDITTNYFDYGVTFDSSEMPTITGADVTATRAITFGANYTILRNVQFTNVLFGIQGYNPVENVVIDRLNANANYDAINGNNAFMIFKKSTGLENIRIKNCVAVNTSMSSIDIEGLNAKHNLIDNCKSYNDRTNKTERNDYHIRLNGKNSIIRNCYAENFNTTSDNVSTHGIGIRGGFEMNSEHILIEKCTSINQNEGLYIRNYGCKYNVIKDCIATKTHTGGTSSEVSGGIYLWGGVDYNVVERNHVSNTIFGIVFKDNYGEDSAPNPAMGDYNIIRNNIVENVKYGICTTANEGPSTCYYNKFYNNTFKDATYFFRAAGTVADIKDMYITNNIFENVGAVWSGSDISDFIFDYNDFYNSWTTGIGTNDVNINPDFVDAANGDYEPQATFTSIDAPTLFGVEYDYNDDERDDTTTTIGAIKHDDE